MGTLISWRNENGGYYPVLCSRCNLQIGAFKTLLQKNKIRKHLDNFHYCSAKVVLITDRIKLAEAQTAAQLGNFALGNKLLREAYSH